MKRLCVILLLASIAFMCTYTLAEETETFLTPLDGIRFPAGDKYPVYYGPGYGYDRMADGKASVSTNGWIRVYGEETGTVLDRHGSPGASILIEYEITEGRHRFGWVASADLPDSVSVWQQLPWQWGYAHTNQTTSVTDDPFYSQTGVATLSAGTDVQVLLEIGDWTYIDAPPIRGFVPSSALTQDEIPYQNDPDLYLNPGAYTVYTYDVQTVERYIQRQCDLKRRTFAIMNGQEMVGELVIKNIEPGKCATMGLAMRNAQYKDRGFGTRAEQLAIRYVFEELDIPVLYADALITNTRSQHVLEKVGFRLIREEGNFRYYSIER